jgi:Peptide methionine sulfoxide reductase
MAFSRARLIMGNVSARILVSHLGPKVACTPTQSSPEEAGVGIFGFRKTQMVNAEHALPGRSEPMPVAARHEVLDAPLRPPYPEGTRVAEFALGCFWGAEKTFWHVPGVVTTAVGYAGGYTFRQRPAEPAL